MKEKEIIEIIESAFIEMLSGIARFHSDGGIVSEYNGHEISVSFPTQSPNYTIIRGYYNNGVKNWRAEFENGVLHGTSKGWYNNGLKWWHAQWKDGEWHGINITWSKISNSVDKEKYENGKLIWSKTIPLKTPLY